MVAQSRTRFILVIVTAVFIMSTAGCAPGTAPSPTSVPPPTNPPSTVAPPAASPSPEPTSTPASSPTPPGFDQLVLAAKAEGQLNVIALPHDWMNYGEVLRTFSTKYGIRLVELQPNAGSKDELTAIRNSRTLGDDKAPDVVDVGLTFAVQGKSGKLFQPYKVSTWETIPDAVKDADGFWYGGYYGLMAFEINRELVATVPADWGDLLDGKQKVALAGRPAVSYQAMMAVYSASLANGGSLDDIIPGLRFFQKLNNAGNLVDLTATGETVASGETPIALRWDYLALADRYARAGEKDILVIIPSSGLLAGLYAQAISVNAPHPNAAKLWMEFLYSDEGQILWMKGFGHPARFADLLERGVIPEEVLDRLPAAEPYLDAVFPTGDQLSAADRAIIGSWTAYVR
jgi:putative spermidine/putrescine transport system substrate-binding protein